MCDIYLTEYRTWQNRKKLCDAVLRHCKRNYLAKLVESPLLLLFVIPAPHQVRDKLQRESSHFSRLWTPAFAGVTGIWTFYEVIGLGVWTK